MEEITVSNRGGMLGVFHGNGLGLDIPKPFERDIFLFETHVAGTSHIEGIKDLEPFLKVGDRLDFFRDPNNLYDTLAIMIKNRDGIRIGFVPKADNPIFARLMDAGKLLFGQITEKHWQNDSWLYITINVYLHE